MARPPRELDCARCGSHFYAFASDGGWCSTDRLFFCERCGPKGLCPGNHRLRRKVTFALFFAGGLAILFSAVTVVGLYFEYVDLQRAQMPVTLVQDLQVGTIAKIGGTMEAQDSVVIQRVGSGDFAHWELLPFAIRDATGQIIVDVGALQGTDSFRTVQRGRHSANWWAGDEVSVIGEIRPGAGGELSLRAQAIAQTPEGFYNPGVVPFVLVGVSTAGWAGFAVATYIHRRRRRWHGARSAAYPQRVGAWRPCGECGELMAPDAPDCPACGWSVKALDAPSREWSPENLRALPTVRLLGVFSERAPWTRGLGVVFAFVLPSLMIAAGLWLLMVTGGNLNTASLILLVFGGAMAAFATHGLLFPRRVLLSPERIEARKRFKHESIHPEEVDRVLTLEKRGDWAHIFATRGGMSLGFGPAISPREFKQAGDWMRRFAEARGIPYWENLTFHDALRLLSWEAGVPFVPSRG